MPKGPDEWTHWTKHGVVRLGITWKFGAPWVSIGFGDYEIGIASTFEQAAHDIGAGKLDEKLGFSGSAFIPSNLSSWNGLS